LAMQKKQSGTIYTGENTLYYKPIWYKTVFNLELLNKEHEKTFFDIVSTKSL